MYFIFKKIENSLGCTFGEIPNVPLGLVLFSSFLEFMPSEFVKFEYFIVGDFTKKYSKFN